MKTVNDQAQIREITGQEVPDLLERLPANGHCDDSFGRDGTKWIYKFTFDSPSAHFAASGSGESPRQAFELAKTMIQRQVDEWHRLRDVTAEYFPRTKPNVLILDDDEDTAALTARMFGKLGCNTTIVSEPSEMHRSMSFLEADVIVLDWKLGAKLEGSDVVERSIRLIDAFSDLRHRFGKSRPQLVTHSVLKGDEIHLPFSTYFHHAGHWQKPLTREEMEARGAELLKAGGF